MGDLTLRCGALVTIAARVTKLVASDGRLQLHIPDSSANCWVDEDAVLSVLAQPFQAGDEVLWSGEHRTFVGMLRDRPVAIVEDAAGHMHQVDETELSHVNLERPGPANG